MKTSVIILCTALACCPFVLGTGSEEDPISVVKVEGVSPDKFDHLSEQQVSVEHLQNTYVAEDAANSPSNAQVTHEEPVEIHNQQLHVQPETPFSNSDPKFYPESSLAPVNIPDSAIHQGLQHPNHDTNPSSDEDSEFNTGNAGPEKASHEADFDEATDNPKHKPEPLNDYLPDDAILSDAIHVRAGEAAPGGEANATTAAPDAASSSTVASSDASSSSSSDSSASSSTVETASTSSVASDSSSTTSSALPGSTDAGNGTSSESTVGMSVTSSPGDMSTNSSATNTTSAPTGDMSTDTANSTSTQKPPKKKLPYKATLNCRCGTQTTRSINVGQVRIEANVQPWTVLINNTEGSFCTGTIINSKYILTSASCVQNRDPKDLNILAALTMSNSSINLTPVKITPHPDYNPNQDLNDIALIEVAEPIQPSKAVKFICLPISADDDDTAAGTFVTLIRESPSNEVVLYTEQVKRISNKRCKSLSNRAITRNVFCSAPASRRCAKSKATREYTGGTYIVPAKGYSFMVKGIVTTAGCKREAEPAVYTEVKPYNSWILHKTKDAEYCKAPSYKAELGSSPK